MNQLLSSPKVKILSLVALAIFLLIVVLLKTGLLKASFTVSRSSSNLSPSEKSADTRSPAKADKSEKTTRALTFGGTDSKPEFTINPPSGWIKGDGEEGNDLAIGSSLPEKLSNGESFTPNVVIVIGRHRFGEKSVEDYVQNWDRIVSEYLPSVEFLETYQEEIDGLPAYVQDRINPRSDSERIRQLHYKFFVDKNFTMAVTASVPEAAWSKHEDVVKAAIGSIKLTQAATLSEDETKSDSQILSYENSLYGLSLEYPSNWQKKENVGKALLVLSTPAGDNVNLMVQGQRSQNLTLEYYNQISMEQLADLAVSSLEERETTLAGEPGYQVTYTINNGTLKLWQVWMIKDNLAYLLTYTASAGNFDKYLSDVQAMVGSFRVE